MVVTFETINQSVSTCVQTSAIRQLTVHPTPTVTDPGDLTYCNGATVTIPLSGSPSGVVYDITGGASVGLNNQTGVAAIPTFTATNSGSVPVTATVTITPRANGCTG